MDTQRRASLLLTRHTVAFKLKAVFLLVIVIIFIYLEAIGSVTSNWSKTRSVGFSEKNSCLSPGKTYTISDAYTTNTEGKAFNIPFAYQFDPQKGSQVCFANSGTLNRCMDQVFSQLPYSELNEEKASRLFATATGRSYFPLNTWILLFSCLALFITQIYEKKTCLFVPTFISNALSDRAQSRIMTKANYVLCFIVVGMLLSSAASFTALYTEDCKMLFREIPGDALFRDAGAFCNGLAACNVAVTTVIDPNEFIFQNYTPVLIVLALVLMFSTVIQCCSPVFCGRDPDDLFAVNQSSFYDASNRVGPTLLDVLRGRRGSDEIRLKERADLMSKHWVAVPYAELMSMRSESSKFDGECPICLSALCADRFRMLLRKKPLSTLRISVNRSFDALGASGSGRMQRASFNSTTAGNADSLSGRNNTILSASVRLKPMFLGTEQKGTEAVAPDPSRRGSLSGGGGESGMYSPLPSLSPVGGAGLLRGTSFRRGSGSGRHTPLSASASGDMLAKVADQPLDHAAGLPRAQEGNLVKVPSRSPSGALSFLMSEDGLAGVGDEEMKVDEGDEVDDEEDDTDQRLPPGHTGGAHTERVEGWVEGFVRRFSQSALRLSDKVEDLLAPRTMVKVETHDDEEDTAAGAAAAVAVVVAGAGALDAADAAEGALAESTGALPSAEGVLGVVGGSGSHVASAALSVPSPAPVAAAVDAPVAVAPQEGGVSRQQLSLLSLRTIEESVIPQTDTPTSPPISPSVDSRNPYGDSGRIPFNGGSLRSLPRLPGDLEDGMFALNNLNGFSPSAATSPRSEPTDATVVVEVPCKHIFHRSCIMEWALTSTLCPLCRASLGGPELLLRRASVESLPP